MVRTKGSAGARVQMAAVSKKYSPSCRSTPAVAPKIASSSTETKTRNPSIGNSYCARETPVWQKPITSFFNQGKSEEMSESSVVPTKEGNMNDDYAVPGTSHASAGASTSSSSNNHISQAEMSD